MLYLKDLSKTYTPSFLILLVIIKSLLKGFCWYGIYQNMIFPYFRYMDIDVVNIQIYFIVMFLPWTMKPIFGVLLDFISIHKYQKLYWSLLSCIFGIIGTFILCFATNTIVIIICFLLFNYQVAMLDLVAESKYSEIMRKNPESGNNIVSFVYACEQFGLMIAIPIVGILSDYSIFTPLLIILFVICVLCIPPFIANFLPNDKIENYYVEEKPKYKQIIQLENELKNKKKMMLFMMFIGVSGLIISIVSLFLSKTITLLTICSILIIIPVGTYLIMFPIVTRVVIFTLITGIAYPSFDTVLEYFYVQNDIGCIANNPNFSFTYYITIIGTLVAFVGFASSLVYQLCTSKLRYRYIIIFTNMLYASSYIFDILMLLNINNTYLNISNEFFYAFAKSYKSFFVIMYLIVTSSLNSKICYPKLETMMYAFTAGIFNLSESIANSIGVLIYGYFDIMNDCNIDKLWILILIFNVFFPIIVVSIGSLLIPNLKQTDNFILNEIEENDDQLIELEEYNTTSDDLLDEDDIKMIELEQFDKTNIEYDNFV